MSFTTIKRTTATGVTHARSTSTTASLRGFFLCRTGVWTSSVVRMTVHCKDLGSQTEWTTRQPPASAYVSLILSRCSLPISSLHQGSEVRSADGHAFPGGDDDRQGGIFCSALLKQQPADRVSMGAEEVERVVLTPAASKANADLRPRRLAVHSHHLAQHFSALTFSIICCVTAGVHCQQQAILQLCPVELVWGSGQPQLQRGGGDGQHAEGGLLLALAQGLQRSLDLVPFGAPRPSWDDAPAHPSQPIHLDVRACAIGRDGRHQARHVVARLRTAVVQGTDIGRAVVVLEEV
mmetsp:Transcript_17161/g.41221  ORF Transcript_17161/g.41221 Transcript_17161/m.41221 type:complete len:293 (+) Transcript_17161:23-901(+)